MVKWTYKGEVFNLEIEFEDSDPFAEAMAGMDVDMQNKDDGSGNTESRGAEDEHQLANGPRSTS